MNTISVHIAIPLWEKSKILWISTITPTDAYSTDHVRSKPFAFSTMNTPYMPSPSRSQFAQLFQSTSSSIVDDFYLVA